MSVWRRKALEALPENRKIIESSESPMALWIELYLIFKNLAKKNYKDPKVRKILNYAAWCLSDKSGKLPNDTSTAVICAFYEDIPTHREFWPYFKEWFYPHEFEKIKSYFKYHLSDDEIVALENTYKK